MRIVYGVHGYGRGHATRTLALLPELRRHHQVLLIAGGDAHAALWQDYPVVRVPTLGFSYGPGSGRRSNWHTLRRNLPAFLDLLCAGPVFEMVRSVIQDFAPDVVISDAEAWTHQVAQSLHIPRISIDHIGIMAYCHSPLEWQDRLEAGLDTLVYRTLMGRPERIIVSSFFDAPPRRPGVQVIGTLVRPELRQLTPCHGEHLLVYFNRGKDQLNSGILTALQNVGCPVHLYGSNRQGRDGNILFLPPSNLPFLEDLASCRAVISTAGNQLMGEAIHLRKPVLVMPERCVEQRLNAAAVERLGIGMRIRPSQLTPTMIRNFLGRLDEYRRNMEEHARDGLQEALEAIDTFLHELAPQKEERVFTAETAEIAERKNRKEEMKARLPG